MPPIFRNATARVTKSGPGIPYATKDQILKQIRPVLNEKGFSLFCLLKEDETLKSETATWTLAGHGHQIESRFRFGVVNESAQMWQQWGGAETYKSRKALCNLLGLDAGDEEDLDGWDPETTSFEDTPTTGKKNLTPSFTATQTETQCSVSPQKKTVCAMPTKKPAATNKARHQYAEPKLCSSIVEALRKATAGRDDQLEIAKARFGAAFPDFLEMEFPSFTDFVKETKHVDLLQEILIALKSGDLAPIQEGN